MQHIDHVLLLTHPSVAYTIPPIQSWLDAESIVYAGGRHITIRGVSQDPEYGQMER